MSDKSCFTTGTVFTSQQRLKTQKQSVNIGLSYSGLPFWTLDCGRKGPMNWRLSFRSSVLLSFRPEVFMGLAHQLFLKLSIVLEAHVCCCTWQGQIFLKKKKKNCPKNGENRPKIGFFESIGKFSHLLFLNLV